MTIPLNLQPTLQNDLVLIRPLEITDFDPLFRVASDPLIWTQHPSDRYEPATFSSFFEESIKSAGALTILDLRKNQVIGSTRFKKLENTDTAIEIGWTFLARSYWGGYYNKSIKQLMIDYAFQAMDEVIFYVDKNNIRSQKALEKIGAGRISGNEFAHLVSDNPDNFTFRINKASWKP